MNCFELVLLNIALITFPLILYLFYIAYNKRFNKSVNRFMLDFALITSFYLTIKFGNDDLNCTLLMTTIIPLIIAFYKKNILSILLLSLFSIISYYYYFHFDLIILLFEYMIYFLIYGFFTKRKFTDFCNTIIIIKAFFLAFMLWNINYYASKNIYEVLLNVFLVSLIVYLILQLVYILLGKGEEILKYHMTIKNLEEEKQVRESLFKIAHEIKNPMAVCKGYFDMLDINNQDQVRKYLPIIKEEIERTLVILQDFLSITKVNIKKDLMDINLLIEDVVDSYKPILKNKGIIGRIHLLDDEVYINGDYERLKQVFINVIKNSIESIESNDGVIEIETLMEKNKFNIKISDNGIGMSEEILKKLYEPFFTTKKNGTGLGIVLSKEILSAHNATIDYESVLNKGTTVLISIPI